MKIRLLQAIGIVQTVIFIGHHGYACFAYFDTTVVIYKYLIHSYLTNLNEFWWRVIYLRTAISFKTRRQTQCQQWTIGRNTGYCTWSWTGSRCESFHRRTYTIPYSSKSWFDFEGRLFIQIYIIYVFYFSFNWFKK